MQKVNPKKSNRIYISQKSLATVIAVIAFLMMVMVSTANIIAEKIKCAVFGYSENGYELAQKALLLSPRLDGDKDGIACESLKNNQKEHVR